MEHYSSTIVSPRVDVVIANPANELPSFFLGKKRLSSSPYFSLTTARCIRTTPFEEEEEYIARSPSADTPDGSTSNSAPSFPPPFDSTFRRGDHAKKKRGADAERRKSLAAVDVHHHTPNRIVVFPLRSSTANANVPPPPPKLPSFLPSSFHSFHKALCPLPPRL